MSLPYLSGLAAAVRVTLDARVPTMGVFASGRLVVNPVFAEKLRDNELIFVLAHELLHLALRTHDRARGSHHLEFNYAHDYIINDILRNELGMEHVPAGGLDMPGASKRSAEEIVLEMRRNAEIMPSKTAVFGGRETTVGRLFGPRGRGPGGDAVEADAGDVLGTQREKEMFPGDVAQQAEAVAAREGACVEQPRAGARGRCAQGAARRRSRRDIRGGDGAPRHLPDTVGSRPAAVDGIGCARASARSCAHRAAGPTAPMSCCQAGAAKAGCSPWFSTRADR